MHVQDRMDAILLSYVDTLHHLLEVSHVVLPHDGLQAGPEHPQPDHIVAHTGHQPRVILRVGIPRVNSLVSPPLSWLWKIIQLEPGVKMSCDRYERSRLHHHIVPMEYPFSSIIIYNSVCARVHIKFSSSP